jgi:hypothetical protein
VLHAISSSASAHSASRSESTAWPSPSALAAHRSRSDASLSCTRYTSSPSVVAHADERSGAASTISTSIAEPGVRSSALPQVSFAGGLVSGSNDTSRTTEAPPSVVTVSGYALSTAASPSPRARKRETLPPVARVNDPPHASSVAASPHCPAIAVLTSAASVRARATTSVRGPAGRMIAATTSRSEPPGLHEVG